jgi:hypothetical protein
MPFSFLPSLPPRRQYFRRDVRRGTVRESNYYFTPNRWRPEPLLLTELSSKKIGEPVAAEDATRINLRASDRKKTRKAQLSRAENPSAV